VNVVVTAGASVDTDVELVPLPGSGAIAGRLVGTGAAPGAGVVTVVLSHRDDRELVFVQTVACAMADAGVLGSFRFDDLPPGPYAIAVRADDFTRWRMQSETVMPGELDLRLQRRDGEPAADLELRAVDAATGARIDAFDAFVRLDGDDRQAKVLAATRGRLVLANVPLDAAIEWVVRAAGHAPLRGDRRALAAPARLVPGWGNTLRCVDRAGRPVPGVALTIDGRPAGATDARGGLSLRAEQRPQRLLLAGAGHRAVAGDLLPDGAFRDLIWGITVVVVEASESTQTPEERR
jgi:hypothetical protein